MPCVLERAKHLGRRAARGPVELLDGVDEGGGRAALELRHAADIGGHDHVGRDLGDIGELALAQLAREFGLEQIISAGRAAAEMTLGNLEDVEPGLVEQRER